MAAELPDALASFIKEGGCTLQCEDGDWDLNIVPAEDSPFRKELPKSAVMIAENGCGDCLFLKKSPKGATGKSVFVFWHEEDRCEKFAPDITALLKTPTPTTASASIDHAAPTKIISLADLEKVVTDPKRGSYRTEVMRRFKAGSFGLEALPLLRKILNYDDIFSSWKLQNASQSSGPPQKRPMT